LGRASSLRLRIKGRRNRIRFGDAYGVKTAEVQFFWFDVPAKQSPIHLGFFFPVISVTEKTTTID
jgi:hypothetical protein